MEFTQYLIVKADGSCSVRKTPRNLGLDEVAFRLNINLPDAWGEVVGDIDVQLPEPPTTEIVQDLTALSTELNADP